MTRPTCIDLRQRFGSKYRITHDESYEAERPEFRAAEEVWLQQIPCQHGHICPWGGDLLAACTNGRGPTAKKLMDLLFVDRNRSQDGDDGVNAVFPVEHFAIVAEIMRPKRRRRLSPEARAAAVARLKAYRFTAAKRAGERQGRAQAGLFDLGAVQAAGAEMSA